MEFDKIYITVATKKTMMSPRGGWTGVLEIFTQIQQITFTI